MKYNIYYLTLVLALIVSCSPKYALNKKEIEYAKSNRVKTVFISYDNHAIKNAMHNGIYKIKVSETTGIAALCLMDTNLIKLKAFSIANAVSKFMGHKENHLYIEVEMEGIAKGLDLNTGGEQPSCNYKVRMPLDSLSLGKIVGSSGTYDPNAFRKF